MKYTTLLIAAFLFCQIAIGQGFISSISNDDMSLIAGQPCVVELASGETIEGKLGGMTAMSGYISKINVKLENGEKMKLKPENVVRLKVKASKLAQISMMAESSSSIKEMTKTDYEEVLNREYIIYETAMRHNKKGKLRLMQLLNPGFDSKIKVFVDPNANETMGVGVGGVKLTGGEDKSYMFVINDEKAVKV